MSTPHLTLCVILVLALLAPGASQSLAQPAASLAAPASPAAPGAMLIVENAGQWPAAARFQVWNSPLGNGTTWLAEDAIWLVVSRQVDKEEVDKVESRRCDDPFVYLSTCLPPSSFHALKLTFPGSNPDVRIEPFGAVDTTVSYFLGDDPEQWRPAVPVWGGVRYIDLYPGVDLVLGGRDSAWRFEAAPGAVAEQIKVQVVGADVVALVDGTLQLDAAGEALSIVLPVALFSYRAIGQSRQDAPIVLATSSGHRPSQPARPADDPGDLLYSTFLGGSSSDGASAIAVDGSGSAYVTGSTTSNDFPSTPGAFDPSLNGGVCGASPCSDVFVAKLNPAGSALVFATFLGGNGDYTVDSGRAIAVDGTGNAYITGETSSTDFPTTPGGFDPTFNGNGDAFAVKLNSGGSMLVYSTFLGGTNSDRGYGIAVNRAGSAYLTGDTISNTFPTTPGAFDRSTNGFNDAFVTVLDPAGSSLTYATFLGGSAPDYGFAIAIDAAGSAYVTGLTASSDYPTTPGAFDLSFNGIYEDAFVTKLNAAGSTLTFSTFLGGSSEDSGYGIAADGVSSAYLTGRTGSSDFPTTPDAFDTSYNGGLRDAFVAKLNFAGSELTYSTFLGGSSTDPEGGATIAVDGMGSTYIGGYTRSSDFPTTPQAFDTSYNGGADAFSVKLSPQGNELDYATFLGGSSNEGGTIALDDAGIAYVAGRTDSSDFPTTPGAFDTSYHGGGDAYVVKLAMQPVEPYEPDVMAPIEQPQAGAYVSGAVTLRGFAIDRASAAGTGIDMVHIYLDGPYGIGTIIGGATYGLERPDIAAQYGERFRYSGWQLAWNTTAVSPGAHQLYLYAHRTTDNAWSLMDPHLVIVPGGPARWLPIMLRQR